MSYDWSTYVFVIGHITNVMLNASEIDASEGKQRQKVGGIN